MVAGVFLSLFQDSALTILHCFCLDEELKKDGRGGERNFTPECLTGFIEMADLEAKRKSDGSKINPK